MSLRYLSYSEDAATYNWDILINVTNKIKIHKKMEVETRDMLVV